LYNSQSGAAMLTDTTQENLIEQTTPAAMLQMAGWHARSGDPVQAERCYRWVIEREPHNMQALHRLALLLLKCGGQANDALPLIEAAVAAEPRNATLHTSRALVLNQLGRGLDALDYFSEACRLAPANPSNLYNLGLHLADLCSSAQAEVIARHLITHYPDWPSAHYLLLRALTGLESDPAELGPLYSYLLKSDPLNTSLRFAHSLLHLKNGNYAAGWEGQEWRWDIEPAKSSRLVFPQPRWAGGPLEGRRLLVAGEQGFGDVLQFARYLPMLVRAGAHVILQLDDNRAALARLLGQIKGVEIVIGTENLPAFDMVCPLASLPYVFDTTPRTIPSAPYLKVDPKAVVEWQERLASLPRPWIGVCWAGSLEHSHNIRRSLPLCANSRYYVERQEREIRILSAAARVADALGLDGLNEAADRDATPAFYSMEPLLRRQHGTLISLQIGPHASDINELPADLRARMFAPLTPQADFYDTACLIHALDEVLTVDTSVAHVAGAIGQRGTIIKPAAPEWRWNEHNGKSAWYPTMTLLDQHALAPRF
jgi:tetratricopeptide (TPR) repeat protein